MPNILTESEVEQAALDLLSEMGYAVVNGPEIAPAPDGIRPERERYSDVVLVGRLRRQIERLNPKAPAEVRDEAVRTVLRSESQKLIANNEAFHRILTEGISLECRRRDGSTGWETVRLVDFENPENNEFLAVNQFTVIENQSNRRPDIVLFVNGLPLGVLELKNPTDENATLRAAFNQLQTYKEQLPSLFQYNEVLAITDGLEARAGTITSGWEWFLPWKTTEGKRPAKETTPQLEVMLRGIFDKRRFLDIVRNFIVFEKDRKETAKKMAAYHQYHAVNKAVEATLKAASPKGDKRCGVVWHTQGSGKSLSMVFYAGKLVTAMDNPTIVVLTDRNDLDDQLFGSFGRCQHILRQKPVQSGSRAELRSLLKTASGGIVFTTIQKFLPEQKGDRFPLLSERRNIVVIADEAHRSQYDFIDGFAKHMREALPNASFIGFTGTPIEKADRSTHAVFGDYIDVYDIGQAVEDGATVRIYYESRLAKLELKPKEKIKLDPNFEEVTEGEEAEVKERLKSKWARLEALVGNEKRIRRVAKDIVSHFEERLSVLDGKGMIVCMSRRICVELHDEIVKLRPEWYGKEDDKGLIKVVMTGSASDPLSWQEHIRNKPRRHDLGERMKNPADPLKLAIVRDMWLTGFDAPSLHTMYMDKPMRSHGLMQAIARVNRVFKDKPGGLIVDYLGIADELKKALAEYSEGDRKETGIPQEKAVAIMLEKYEVASRLFHRFEYKRFFTASPREKMAILLAATEHVLRQKDGKELCLKYVTELSKSFALAVPHEEALMIRDDVGFFQAVRSAIAKNTTSTGTPKEDLDSAIRQIISKAVASNEVVDIFAAAGLKKPDISILSEEFLAEVRGLPYKNLAFELLTKLLNDEIKIRSKKNLIQGRSFSEMLEKAIKRYHNKSIETARIIEELIELAKEMRKAGQRGEELGLTEDELAFYDALEVNDSAVKVLGDETLRTIARELVKAIHADVTIDWTLKP